MAATPRTVHPFRSAGTPVATPKPAKSENRNGSAENGNGNGNGGENGQNGEESGNGENGEETRFTYTPYGAASIGFDTNPDELLPPDATSTAFQRYDTGLSIGYDHDGVTLDFDAQGEFIDLFAYDDPRRWYYRFGLDGSVDLTSQSRFRFGAVREHDKLTDPETVFNSTYAGVERRARRFHIGIKGIVEQELNLTGDDDFGSELAEAFDYVKPSVEVDLLLAAHKPISPYFRAAYASVNYPRQDLDLADRDARDYWLAGGAALRPSKTFRLDFGVRYNNRETDDAVIPEFSSTGADVRVAWVPSDKMSLRGSITREIDETGTEASILTDLTTFKLAADVQPTDKFGLNVSGAHSVAKEIGVDETSLETTLEGKAYYKIRDELRLFTAVRRSWFEDNYFDETTDRYTRTVVRGGIETDF